MEFFSLLSFNLRKFFVWLLLLLLLLFCIQRWCTQRWHIFFCNIFPPKLIDRISQGFFLSVWNLWKLFAQTGFTPMPDFEQLNQIPSMYSVLHLLRAAPESWSKYTTYIKELTLKSSYTILLKLTYSHLLGVILP